MKRFLLLLLTVASLSAGAQLYNNEWIDYNKTYYKFKVATTGLYRIPQTVLASIGLQNANANEFQLWRNGQQIPLYTSVQGGTLGATDYIEFWGEMNDGKPDAPLYRELDYQLSDKWSLQTDSAAFFLTVNTLGNNLRLVPTPNDVNGNTLAPEPYFMHTYGQYYKNKINTGRSEIVGTSFTYSASYDMGEGWTSADIGTGASVTVNATGLQPYTGIGAPDPLVHINAAGNATHARDFRVRLNGDSIIGRTMDYYDYAKVSQTVSINQISAGTAAFQITNLGVAASDRMVISKIELIYPRKFNFGNATNFYFELPANTAGNYLEIAGFSYSGSAPVLYDLTNGKRYEANTTTATLLKIILLPSSVDRKLVLVSEAPANLKQITSVQQRNFINYELPANQGNYIIVTHPILTAASGGSDPVEEYRSYRNSAQGGSYNARVYLIDQLEDQFGLGLKRHPLSIRNFLRWARANYSSPLKSVFLIGKGVIYTSFIGNQANANMEKLNLVPTFGFPASDNLLTADGNSSVPLTPIGRISVINKEEVADYLEKVKQYEQVQSTPSSSIEDKAWMKNIIHVTGASDNNTTDILLEALNGHKRIIEDTFYSGNVHTFTKYSADAVQQVASTRLTNLFKEGLGLLTYFGHSSASTLEFNLDNPYNYDNQGKYPVFVVMGCNAGSLFNFNVARLSTKETISEKFVLAKERGAIAFLASTHLGIVHYLDIYNTRFYRAMSTTRYGATLGEIMDEAIAQVFATTSENDFYARFQCEEFTLNGDPALNLYHSDKPDYVIEDPLVKVSPSFIPVSERFFKVSASFMNIGKAVNKDIIIEIKRTYPDNSVEVIKRDTISFTKFMDSLSYEIPIDGIRDRGLNKITVTIDAGNAVDELYETNNTVTKDFYIVDNDVKPVYPYDFSIVNQQDIKLVASSADPFAPAHEYRMEIDTTELFDSPLKRTGSINATGGVIEFTPGIIFTDSTVYYWRVGAAVAGGEPVWNVSSFQYIANGNLGFSQAHYYQHLKSDKLRIELDNSREWKYIPVTNNLYVANGVWGTAITQEGSLVVNVNDSSYIRNACGFGFVVNIFDKNTFQPWKNQVVAGAGLYGSSNPGCAPSRIHNFEYPNNEAGRNRLLGLLRFIPDGNYAVIRFVTQGNAANQYVNNWKNDEITYGAGNSMYTELKNQGFTDIDSIYRQRAFSFVYKRNRPAEQTPAFVISDGIFDPITLSVNCVTRDSIGYITSPKIGPAKSWSQLHWRGSSDALGDDEPFIDVYGISSTGTETLLFNGLSYNEQDHDISTINAGDYPYVKLKMKNQDRFHFTPYQLRYWMLNYNPVPEGAVAPNIYFTTKDTISIGQTADFGIAFKNVSKVDFDSVKVKFTITDKNNVENIVPVPRQKKLIINDTIKLNVPIDSRSLSGDNTIFVNFNPENDQPEQYLFNNYAFRKLFVIPDSLNPTMDVTFDGMHILNKDIISAKPKILVKLSDELKSLILDDTSLIIVNVRYPNGDIRRFNFNNSDTLQFISASQGDNTASVNFTPYFPEDGEYDLIVSGKDRSGNFAGNVQYKVSFTIINKPMISNMLNYPNPFTTATAFVFTVTGSEVPQNIRIQVLTITGKIVREITKDELGPLHIGRNITEFKWDGTDQYGQKLANGIYLYRVITNLNGKALDKYKAKDDNTDKYFNKGYGKMYLMR